MDERHIERILRDVAASQGIRMSILRVQRATSGWLVTITDQADRIVSTRVPDGPPAAVRITLLHWLEANA
jgi:hypothetical protein